MRYVLKFPSEAGVIKARYPSGVELMRLIPGRKAWKGSNVELRKNLPLFIYSHDKQRYWFRLLGSDHDLSPYRQYIQDGNLYIWFDDMWKQRVQEEREKEGLGYYQYNKLRELILVEELLDQTKEGRPDYQSKKRALQIEKQKIEQKRQKT